MDGSSAKKSTSLETLVIQNITNLNELKTKLSDIINNGRDYEYDVSSCLKTLINSSDQDIVLLTIQAISELTKCETKRESYAQKDLIQPIIRILHTEVNSGKTELLKQSCRALGNLCCDCDTSRKILLECNGVCELKKLVEQTLKNNDAPHNEIKLLACKCLLNFAIGGQEFSEMIVQENLIELLHRILDLELNNDDMSDEMVSTSLLILSVISDNDPEILFDDKVNKAVLDVLRETNNVEISELCLDHLHAQAEHDGVKTLIANEGGLQLVCTRLEQLMMKCDNGDLEADESEVEAIVKQACDLIIIVLTGGEFLFYL
ncbi:unnamed protein product [Diatraea saccharalis]|uniref:Uncharacterized protein n=1 Tax=Diatraea saccharalis TaxID=40085 RepID=A0A9N9WA19_9NEOP|nr:unnamed protein product [Diatraea saccharalis]